MFTGTGTYPDSMVHGANMGPIWGRKDPGGPQVGPMNFPIWVVVAYSVVVKTIVIVIICHIIADFGVYN